MPQTGISHFDPQRTVFNFNAWDIERGARACLPRASPVLFAGDPPLAAKRIVLCSHIAP
jgi:hypothetical protein